MSIEGLKMHLSDPRAYARVNVKQPLIRLTMAALTAETTEKIAKHAALLNGLKEVLEVADEKQLALALSLLPDETATRYFWTTLFEALNTQTEVKAFIYALPILLVAAAKDAKKTELLPLSIPDLAGLRLALQDLDMLADTAEIKLSDALLSIADLEAATPVQIATWQAEGLSLLPLQASSAAQVKGEAVYLRFVLCTTPKPLLDTTQTKWAMRLTEILSQQFTQAYPSLTILPIVRRLQPLLNAMLYARQERQEIALQLFVSGQLRRLREKNATPIVCYAMHIGGEFRMSIGAAENTERWEGFVWRLHPLDSVMSIQESVERLLRDCLVQDVRPVYTLQADEEGGVPYFVTARHIEPAADYSVH